MDASQELRRSARRTKFFGRCTRGRKRIERNVDAIERAKILPAILQMIVDLQRRAQRIVRGPRDAAFAMHIEHETPDRHGRVGTIIHEIIPVAIAQLGHIHPERRQEVLGVTWRQLALAQRRPQCHAFANGVVLAEEARFEPVEEVELLLGFQRGMIRHVVRGAHEFVEREDDAAVARMNEPRRHRKVLVAVGFSRSQCARLVHHAPLAWMRPFHDPPLPRANCRAESSV